MCLVNCWAIYFPPFREEIPDIQRFANDNKDRIVVIGMNARGSKAREIEAFKKELGISYPLIHIQKSTMLLFGLILGIPTSFVINLKGEIVDKFVGIISYYDLDNFIHPPQFICSQ